MARNSANLGDQPSSFEPLGRGLRAFTLIELLVVGAILAVLSGLLLTAITRATSRSRAIACANAVRQLALGAILYAGDHMDGLPYNLGTGTGRGIAPRSDYNWANNLLTWELDSDNTNTALMARSSFAPYAGPSAGIYSCPEDRIVSAIQRQAGWSRRVRSFAMNAMVGDAGENSRYGTNLFNPGYRQFKRLSDFQRPAEIFVFLDEHPDSINDGYFLNQVEKAEWMDLPGSYHQGAATLSFADGHVAGHRWKDRQTSPPPRPDAAPLPLSLEPARRNDFDWVILRTTTRY